MLEYLKKQVYEANMRLVKYNLVLFTSGNVSGIDRKSGLVVIKPSGVDYDELSPLDLPVVDMDGNVVEGYYRPSSDTPTHIELYRAFPKIKGITHTHSPYATSYAQAGRSIRPLGTTHADYFCGTVPCTRKMTSSEIATDYEKNTGLVIAETFKELDYETMPAVLVNSHGPFAWGDDAFESVDTAMMLENVSQMAYQTEQLQLCIGVKGAVPIQQDLLNKHFYRKNGPNAYYGQENK